MEYVKLENENGSYGYKGSTSIKMDIIGFFLADDIGCYSPTFREWATKDHWEGASGSITMVEKEDHFIYLTDLYSEEDDPTELKMTVQQFVQLLDDWRDKVCSAKPKEVIIKYENDQFIIETKN